MAAAAYHYAAALDIKSRVLGDDHPEVRRLRADLATLDRTVDREERHWAGHRCESGTEFVAASQDADPLGC